MSEQNDKRSLISLIPMSLASDLGYPKGEALAPPPMRARKSEHEKRTVEPTQSISMRQVKESHLSLAMRMDLEQIQDV